MPFITDLINKITNFRVKVGDKLNTLKNQIGQLNSLTTNDKTSLVGAVNEVNNIKIGGRNLLLQTTTSEINLFGGVDIYAEKEYKISNLEKNTEYIFSVIAKGDEMTLISFIPNVIVDYKSLTTEFKLYTWKFSTSNEPAILYFLIRAQGGKNITITKAKLEQGNKATDWTPAPEDQVSDWAETDSTKFSFIKNKPTIPTVNNGKLTLTTGTGLNGSTNFTANQSSNSIFDVSIASTHKLPSTAEFANTLKKDESNIVTDDFSITDGFSTLSLGSGSYVIKGELPGVANVSLGTDDGYAVSYYTNNGGGFFSGVDGIKGYAGVKNWSFLNDNGISLMLMPETGDTKRVLTTGAKIGSTTYYANNQGVIELPEYSAYTAGNGLTLSGTVFSLPVTTSGSGNVISSVTQTANGISVSKDISAMTTSHVANGITSTNINNWNTAFTNNHTHSNKAFLDNVDQNLSKTSVPTFDSIELSAPIPYIDFHYANSAEDYTSRIIETDLGHLQNVVKSKFSVHIDGQSTQMMSIDGRSINLGQSTNQNFEAIYLRTFYGSLDFDDEGLQSSLGITAPAFYESSLRKYKKNIKEYSNSALDIVKSLDVVTYDRTDSDISNKIGVIADDSHEDVLNEEKTAIDLYKTIFVLTKAVQELSEKVEKLESKIV